MINVVQTIRFVAENVSVRWANLTPHERAVCLLRMRSAWPAFAGSCPDSGMELLKIADALEAQEKAVAVPVPPRSFNYLHDKATYQESGTWGCVRAGADDHKRHATRGERN